MHKPDYEEEVALLDAKRIVKAFLKEFNVGQLLKECNAYKKKGYPVMDIFIYLLCLMFTNVSSYMANKIGTYNEPFSKNTIRRFCNDASINWHKFLRLLSSRLASKFMRPATSDDREEYYILDDTPFEKTGKATELTSVFHNHVTGKFCIGYRILTLICTDGTSNIPIDFVPLSSSDKDKDVKVKECDKRTLAYKIRKDARTPAPELVLKMLKEAKDAGHKAKTVLFDSWFSTPKLITDIVKQLSLNCIGMLKKNRTRYEYNDEVLSLTAIYNKCKKRRGRSKYLLSVTANLLQWDKKEIVSRIPVKLVFVRNKNNKKQWAVLVSTDITLSEEEIMRRYGYRWNIETYFKDCKQYLKYCKECQSTSFDSLTMHLALVNVRYMILSVTQRREQDHRSLGELFLYLQEAPEITLTEALNLFMVAVFESIQDIFGPNEDQMVAFLHSLIFSLPPFLQRILKACEQKPKAA